MHVSVHPVVNCCAKKHQAHQDVSVPTRTKEAHLIMLHGKRRDGPAMALHGRDELPGFVADGEQINVTLLYALSNVAENAEDLTHF